MIKKHNTKQNKIRDKQSKILPKHAVSDTFTINQDFRANTTASTHNSPKPGPTRVINSSCLLCFPRHYNWLIGRVLSHTPDLCLKYSQDLSSGCFSFLLLYPSLTFIILSVSLTFISVSIPLLLFLISLFLSFINSSMSLCY